ncbi:MAG TPA: hypothetical protein VMR75_02430 [Candidatus Saccharimonadales bacterium]|jgi:hypothetical protein|nr:hypothetical protein [Candidatus Saccharimonadales bacterium]
MAKPPTRRKTHLAKLRNLVLAGIATVGVAEAVKHVESGERQDPEWSLTSSAPNLPANGSSEDTEDFRARLKGNSTVPDALATFELGDAADGKGILAAKNPVVSEGKDRMVLGVTTANGPQTFVLDSAHYEINVLDGNNSGPIATNYAEAKQIVDEHVQEVTLDTVGLGGETSSTTGHINSPDLNEEQVGVLIRFTEGPDGQLTATQG